MAPQHEGEQLSSRPSCSRNASALCVVPESAACRQPWEMVCCCSFQFQPRLSTKKILESEKSLCWKGPLEVIQLSILLGEGLIRFLRDLTNEILKTSKDGDSICSNPSARWVHAWRPVWDLFRQIEENERYFAGRCWVIWAWVSWGDYASEVK